MRIPFYKRDLSRDMRAQPSFCDGLEHTVVFEHTSQAPMAFLIMMVNLLYIKQSLGFARWVWQAMFLYLPVLVFVPSVIMACQGVENPSLGHKAAPYDQVPLTNNETSKLKCYTGCLLQLLLQKHMALGVSMIAWLCAWMCRMVGNADRDLDLQSWNCSTVQTGIKFQHAFQSS